MNVLQGMSFNRTQFILLVFVNAFVGSMVGLERSVLAGFGERIFHINGKTALLSFIVAFGISKSMANLLMGKLAKHISRKHILIIGWIAALPVPFLLMYATSWNYIILANLFLGINQGLAWSATVIMKIDLVGEKDRGFAMGINEFSGYVSVGLAAYLSAYIASVKGFSFFPFIPGIFFGIIGLVLSVFFVKDTAAFVNLESRGSGILKLKNLWKSVSFQHRNMGTVTINGLVNNLNDGMVWGLLPILLLRRNYSLPQIGIIAGMYPIMWGFAQLFTGKLGDIYCKKQLITGGMMLQAAGLLIIAILPSITMTILAILLLGLGTAFVYPNFLSVIAENSHPDQRAETMSIFRFWRDGGYVIGALLAGITADLFGINATFIFVAILTAAAGWLAEKRMCCTKTILWKSDLCPVSS